jgi:NAD(P)-dependent dehydrogenase (short-subunit alcohol dehydrogenase family)
MSAAEIRSDKLPPRPIIKRALVTGASSGIGAAIAEKLLADGWSVIGMSRSKGHLVHERFDFLSVDIEDETALAEGLSNIGAIDAFVHAAGILRVGSLGALSLDQGRKMWRLHTEAAVQIVEHLAPGLRAGGRIVLIGSRTAAGSAGRSQYAATKAALVALARSWAIELAPQGITVNVIAPGATDTPMLNDPKRSLVNARLPPIGRFVKPQEIASLAAFLLSENAASITGQQIVVCGGASL